MLVNFEQGAMSVTVPDFAAVEEILMPREWLDVRQVPARAPGLPGNVEVRAEELVYVNFEWPGRVGGADFGALLRAPVHDLNDEERELVRGYAAGKIFAARTQVLNGRTVIVLESQIDAQQNWGVEMSMYCVLIAVEDGKCLEKIEFRCPEEGYGGFVRREIKEILGSVVW